MYELVILTFLMRGPMHGYLIASILNDMIGPYAKVSHGRLYPLLARLEEAGLIAEDGEATGEPPTDRRQRRFRITESGRLRFRQLMLDTTSNPGDYRALFWIKAPFLGYLTPGERLHILDHYIHYCRAHLFHLTAERDQLAHEALAKAYMRPDELDATLAVIDHYRRGWQVELDDALALRAREVERAESGGASGARLR